MHTDLGDHSQRKGIGYVIRWYQDLTHHMPAASGFDLIGLSMYPKWISGRMFENIAQLPALAAAFPEKLIYIAEIAYPAAGALQPERDFPPTPAGQQQFLRSVMAAMQRTPNACGVLWWELTKNGTESFFDEHFVARPALLMGFQPLSAEML